VNEIHALSGAYAVDALSDAERELFERHLAECAECRAEVDSLREAASLLPATAETVPSPASREAVLAAIRTVRPLPPVVTELPRGRRFRAFLAVAAAAAVIGGVAVARPWSHDPAPSLTAAEQVIQADDAHRQTIAVGEASLTLYHSASRGQAALVTDDLAAAPADHVYELWLQVDGAMVPAGLFDDGGDHEVLLTGNAAHATAAGITVEPDGGSEQPTTTPLALFDLG